MLVFTVLVRAAAIWTVTPAHWLGVFLATALAGRWAAVFPQAIGDPILDDRRSALAGRRAGAGPGDRDARRPRRRRMHVRARPGGTGGLALAAAAAFALGVDAQRRDNGLSAPVVAVAAALGELFVLLAASAA